MATIKSIEYYASGVAGASTLIGSAGTTTRIMRWEIEIPEGEHGTALSLRVAGGEYSGSVDTGELFALLTTDTTAYIDVFGNDITSGYLAKTAINRTTSTMGFSYDYACSLEYAFTPGTYYVFFVPSTTSVGQAYAHKGYSKIELSGSLTYVITFDANGGSEAPAAENVEYGSSITLPTISRSGYAFLGWSENAAAASGMIGSYTPTGSITLYAIWKATGGFMYYNHNGSPVKCEVYYNNNGQAIRCDIYYNNNGQAIKI